MIDTDKYEGHTKEKWCARNVGDGSLISCDEDYDHDIPFMETGEWSNPAIGYLAAGHEAHSLEERRANIKLMADAPLLLQEVKRLDKLCWDIEIDNQKLHEENRDLKAQVDYYCTDLNTLENMNDDLKAEVKRLREAISDIARCMDAADPVYLQGFIKDLYEVIE